MKKTLTMLLCILLPVLCLFVTGCSAPDAPADAPAPAAVSAETGEPAENWQPTLEIERLSPTGAVILFQLDSQPENCLILSGNDYVLQQLTDKGWEDLPAMQDHVYWVKDAFVIAAVPRDDIDWEWLYGSLAPGQYRIGKNIALYQQDQVLERAMVYAEFAITDPDAAPEETIGTTAEIPEESREPVSFPYSYAPLSASTRYGYTDALQSNVVILENGSAIENQHVWSAFVQAANAGQRVTVRCIQLGDDYGFPDVYDVSYDGILYTIHWFENGEEQLYAFKQLVCYREDPDSNTASRYVLVMDRNSTWEDIQWGMVSSDDIYSVAHMVVYQELRYVPSHPPIPEDSNVSLVLGGQGLITATQEQSAKLIDLMSEATYTQNKPPRDYKGLDLVFTDAAGNTVTLWLSTESDYFLYDGSFYRYSKDALWDIFGLTQWPDAVMTAYP